MINLNLSEKFEQGITANDYMASLEKTRDGFLNIYNNFRVPEEDVTFLSEKTGYRILVLAEQWCGHCMLDIPILLRMNEQADLPIRFLPRDRHLDVMDHYLTNEKRFIPIVIFIDDQGEEIAKWGPMAPKIKVYTEDLKQTLPARDSASFDEAQKQLFKQISNTFTNDPTFWHYVYDDLKKTLPTR